MPASNDIMSHQKSFNKVVDLGLKFYLKRDSNSRIVCEVNKTVFFLYKTYLKPKIHKTITSN